MSYLPLIPLMYSHRRILLESPSPEPQPSHPVHKHELVKHFIRLGILIMFGFCVASFVVACWRKMRPRTVRSAQLQALPVLTYNTPSMAALLPSLPTDSTRGEPDDCVVCLGEYKTGEEVRVLPSCKHMFHKECIDEWLVTKSTACPLCRRRVRLPARPHRGNGNPSHY